MDYTQSGQFKSGANTTGVSGTPRGRTFSTTQCGGCTEHLPMARRAATYYYREGDEATEPFWHMFDQVVVRPDFADRLPQERLRILTHAGVLPLIDTDGLPDHNTASDHLPVVFTIL
jgi:hypothetical protein